MTRVSQLVPFRKSLRTGRGRHIAEHYNVKVSAVAAAVLLTTAAAPSPKPSATVNPLTAFSATGSLSATAVSAARSAIARGEIRLWDRDLLTRVDVCNFSLTAKTGTRKISMQIPAGTTGAIFDARRHGVERARADVAENHAEGGNCQAEVPYVARRPHRAGRFLRRYCERFF